MNAATKTAVDVDEVESEEAREEAEVSRNRTWRSLIDPHLATLFATPMGMLGSAITARRRGDSVDTKPVAMSLLSSCNQADPGAHARVLRSLLDQMVGPEATKEQRMEAMTFVVQRVIDRTPQS